MASHRERIKLEFARQKRSGHTLQAGAAWDGPRLTPLRGRDGVYTAQEGPEECPAILDTAFPWLRRTPDLPNSPGLQHGLFLLERKAQSVKQGGTVCPLAAPLQES